MLKFAAILAILTAAGSPMLCSAALNIEGASGEVATAGPVTATVEYRKWGSDDLQVRVSFRSKSYPVGCLSAYRDIRYELRDTKGKLIAGNRHIPDNAPFDGPGVYNHVVKDATPTPCKDIAPQGIWNVGALLSVLYPGLGVGKYMLKLTLEPRGLGVQGVFSPALRVDVRE